MNTVPTLKASVIIPVYNTAAYLPACLGSIAAQTLPQEHFEVILVDDGSTDASLEIAQDYASSHPNVTLIRQEHAMQGAARNRGLEAAQGEYVFFADSDDMLAPDLLEKSCAICDEHGLDFVTFDAEPLLDPPFEKTPDNMPDRSGMGFDGTVLDGVGFWRANYGRGGIFGVVWMHVLRRDFLLDSGIIFEEGVYYEDNNWTLRIYFAARRVTYLPEPLYIRRYRQGSTVMGDFTPLHLKSRRLVHAMMVRLYEEAPDEDRREMALDHLIMSERRLDQLAGVKITAEFMSEVHAFVNDLSRLTNKGDISSMLKSICYIMLVKLNEQMGTPTYGSTQLDKLLRDFFSSMIDYPELRDPGYSAGLYGTGIIGRRFVDAYESSLGSFAARMVGIDSIENGGSRLGMPLVCIDDPLIPSLDLIIIASNRYAQEMIDALRAVGYTGRIERVPRALSIIYADLLERRDSHHDDGPQSASMEAVARTAASEEVNSHD